MHHNLIDGRCSNCGCSEDAIDKFGFKCKADGASPLVEEVIDDETIPIEPVFLFGPKGTKSTTPWSGLSIHRQLRNDAEGLGSVLYCRQGSFHWQPLSSFASDLQQAAENADRRRALKRAYKGYNYIAMRCSRCNTRIDFTEHIAGTASVCPHCGQALSVPMYSQDEFWKLKPIPIRILKGAIFGFLSAALLWVVFVVAYPILSGPLNLIEYADRGSISDPHLGPVPNWVILLIQVIGILAGIAWQWDTSHRMGLKLPPEAQPSKPNAK